MALQVIADGMLIGVGAFLMWAALDCRNDVRWWKEHADRAIRDGEKP